jgi:hypothetical protein
LAAIRLASGPAGSLFPTREFGAFAAVAVADSPHFVRASASGPNNDGSLTVSWKEAGLGDNVLID